MATTQNFFVLALGSFSLGVAAWALDFPDESIACNVLGCVCLALAAFIQAMHWFARTRLAGVFAGGIHVMCARAPHYVDQLLFCVPCIGFVWHFFAAVVGNMLTNFATSDADCSTLPGCRDLKDSGLIVANTAFLCLSLALWVTTVRNRTQFLLRDWVIFFPIASAVLGMTCYAFAFIDDPWALWGPRLGDAATMVLMYCGYLRNKGAWVEDLEFWFSEINDRGDTRIGQHMYFVFAAGLFHVLFNGIYSSVHGIVKWDYVFWSLLGVVDMAVALSFEDTRDKLKRIGTGALCLVRFVMPFAFVLTGIALGCAGLACQFEPCAVHGGSLLVLSGPFFTAGVWWLYIRRQAQA